MTDRKTEKNGVLWFVNRCAGCPWLRKGSKRNPNRCTKLDMEIVETERINPRCPLEQR